MDTKAIKREDGRRLVDHILEAGGALTIVLGIIAAAEPSPLWTRIFVVELFVFLFTCNRVNVATHRSRHAAAADAARLVCLIDDSVGRIGGPFMIAFDKVSVAADAVCVTDRTKRAGPIALPLFAVADGASSRTVVYSRDQMQDLWPGLFTSPDGLDPVEVLFNTSVIPEVEGPTTGALSVILYRTTRSASDLDLFSADPERKRAALDRTHTVNHTNDQ